MIDLPGTCPHVWADAGGVIAPNNGVKGSGIAGGISTLADPILPQSFSIISHHVST